MHPVALILGLAAAGATALAVRARSGSAQLMAALLAMLWAAANMLALMDGPGFPALDLLALVDLPIAFLAFGLWFEQRAGWQSATTVFLALRLPLHVAAGIGALGWVPYIHTINALFLAALVSIGWKGGIDDLVAGIRVRCLRLRDRRLAACSRVVG